MSFNVFSKKSNIGKKVKHQIIDTEPLEKQSPLQPYQPDPYVHEDVFRSHDFGYDRRNSGRTFVIDDAVIGGRRVTQNIIRLDRARHVTLRVRSNTNDRITIATDNNLVYAGRGNDHVSSSCDKNVIYLEEGDDTGEVVGGWSERFSVFYGGTGNDRLTGSRDVMTESILFGGQDDDILTALAPGTQLFGDEGDDTLVLDMTDAVGHERDNFPSDLHANGGSGRDSFVVNPRERNFLYVIGDFSREDQLIFNHGEDVRNRRRRSSFTYQAVAEDRIHVSYEGNLYAEVHLQGWTVFDDDFSTRGGGRGVDLAFGAHGNVPRVMDQEGNMR